jgi:Cys-rich repeat protein
LQRDTKVCVQCVRDKDCTTGQCDNGTCK